MPNSFTEMIVDCNEKVIKRFIDVMEECIIAAERGVQSLKEIKESFL